MPEPAPLSIVAFGDPAVRPAMLAAGEQLGEALSDDAGRSWPVQVTVRPLGDAAPWAPGTIVVAMLQEDLVRLDRPMAVIEAAWRDRMDRWSGLAPGVVVLCTIFGHVDDTPGRGGLIERIRRLNRLVIALSRDYGAFVADIDRTFTIYGAKAVHADYRLNGSIAAEAAAQTIVTSLLASDLGGQVPAERQTSGLKRHGNPSQLQRRIQRRGSDATRFVQPTAAEKQR